VAPVTQVSIVSVQRLSLPCELLSPAEIHLLSLHDALPISLATVPGFSRASCRTSALGVAPSAGFDSGVGSATSSATTCCTRDARSEEHTSELQSREKLVCRLLLEKKKSNHHSSNQDPFI